ncbi:Pyruvate, phosphate dikinase [Candidatus Propionivibrio aalborgensis]|uniref:Pyruvate, phosphate dikinase n=1 Tax=Candidatus Propionivibrio aalborgensis TaxID=1860101 RepID=A0A1A8XR76_9RHOO|nr:pyruvate, phosphate dikinase [Candidatus Propionivibrio aalborgensis]SBT06962.1 Pyruvate, phosphate dikinase [Candidatus Propionivibrio aalborgensis]
MSNKFVYVFGASKTEGSADMKNLLGGKGANLAEMCRLGISVPPGLTISTEACTVYTEKGAESIQKLLDAEVRQGVAFLEKEMGKKFGDAADPLLVSVRSGSRASMPGMMDTILNLGLNDEAVEGLANKSGNERFAWDSYRRFIQMYGDVVMGLKPESKEDHDPFEAIIDELKEKKGVELDTDLDVNDLKEMVAAFKGMIKSRLGREFPNDPWEQLWGSVMAVFQSWNNDRAVFYRQMNDIPGSWGTAVNVQSMVFGNLGQNSGTGVAFTRDAASGEDIFNGEFLINAQGEDVVAGIRTPQQITLEGSTRWADLAQVSELDRRTKYPSLEEIMPEIYQQLLKTETALENHYKDMQDIEFTIQEGKLWMLQTRSAKRTGAALVRTSMEMLAQGLIDEKTALLRVGADRLNELLHPVFDGQAVKKARLIAGGLPASPGAATGQVVFFADEAEAWVAKGKDVILVRQETSPEDLRGMVVAKGILTARGGMTSHAAVVARGMGKCCVSGAGSVRVDPKARTMTIEGVVYNEGDWISLDGSTGKVYEGKVPTKDAELSGDFGKLMELADRYKRLAIRANADSPEDAKVARNFGAVGIGLCRTEHMFFEGDRIKSVREMILAQDEAGRRSALAKLLPMQRGDFEGLFVEMAGLPVTIRLLDPPLHEFLPHDEANQRAMAAEMGISYDEIKHRVDDLHEANPMMGHRGCRLGISYPEITEMQSRAIIEAALNTKAKGVDVRVEIMVPLVGTVREFNAQAKVIRDTIEVVFAERGTHMNYLLGTMIETPRGALVADSIGKQAEFFSFGTNDLTQMTLGFSRDDIGKFLPDYLKDGMYEQDPFQSIDQKGVGLLVKMAVEKGRAARPGIKLGVCGEHGGDPASIDFFHRVGLDYVSCSPFRVPIARLAAAQAAIGQ